mmetsp:Transcript_15950/g.40361  ORF Transcript_15950/g.40361 Transcript_15950/m.40361 type:complete len:139 (-) Transcript_15950:38-454(-)
MQPGSQLYLSSNASSWERSQSIAVITLTLTLFSSSSPSPSPTHNDMKSAFASPPADQHTCTELRGFLPPSTLSAYLLFLDRQDSLYDAYLEWKSQPLYSSFILNQDLRCAYHSKPDFPLLECRMCAAALALSQDMGLK